ncbi:hypothetical protein OnM2_022074b [Erysiphe neolycopersici]|uniref:Integrase catalytic domain-containing protein n=1 Tax=Erysiphe neolycopersici TaxID=212602 RepID=A0A420I2F9_9PEZI|nr:hypothetical protein OnM2_022074b [Erysiphe neolycopersici]
MIEKQFGVSVRIVNKDGEAVFNNKEWVKFVAEKGIVRQVSAPEQNGKSEAAGKWIVVISRALILSSGLPNTPFSEALKCGTYIYNRLPRKFLNDFIEEMMELDNESNIDVYLNDADNQQSLKNSLDK